MLRDMPFPIADELIRFTYDNQGLVPVLLVIDWPEITYLLCIPYLHDDWLVSDYENSQGALPLFCLALDIYILYVHYDWLVHPDDENHL